MPDLVLLGCVKSQRPVAAPAAELFTSPLWVKRRTYAEASTHPWLILSSGHGLLHPDDVVTPYDLPLARQPKAWRDDWGRRVAGDLPRVDVVEVHAGAAAVDALRGPLQRRGIRLLTPLAGLSQGQQLAWYVRSAPAGNRRDA